MKNLAVARRYAKALLLIGKEDGQAQNYKEEIAAVAGMIEKEKALEQALLNPLYDVDARRQVLEAVIKKLDLSAVMASFLMLLFDKRRIGFIGATKMHLLVRKENKHIHHVVKKQNQTHNILCIRYATL